MTHHTNLHKKRQKESGAVMVLCALVLLPMILITALVLDGSLFVTSHLQQNNNAEQVAMAAMRSFIDVTNEHPHNQAIFRQAYISAETVGEKNMYVSSPGNIQVIKGGLRWAGKSGNIVFGQWNPNVNPINAFTELCSWGSSACPATVNAAKVVLKTVQSGKNSSYLRPFFSGILGKDTKLNIRSEVIAYFDGDVIRLVLSKDVPYEA